MPLLDENEYGLKKGEIFRDTLHSLVFICTGKRCGGRKELDMGSFLHG